MDIYSLAATNVLSKGRPMPMDAKAEDRYYRDQSGLPRLNRGLLGSIVVVTTCAILILVSITPT